MNWYARSYGLPVEHASSVVQVIGVTQHEMDARRWLSQHLRNQGTEEWSAALNRLGQEGEDEGSYLRHHQRSELLFAAAASIEFGAVAVEFEGARYEVRQFNPVE